MAEPIGLLVLSTVGVETILGLSATASATLVGSTIILGATVGSTFLLNDQAEKPDVGKNELTLKQAVPARFIDIGRVKTGGVVFFYEAFLTTNWGALRSTLIVGKVMSCSEINDVETVYLNDKIPGWTGSYENQSIASSALYGSPAVQGLYTVLETGRGASTDTVPTSLQAFWGTGTNAILKGLAYSVIQFGQGDDPEVHQNLYPGGPPNVMCVIKGCKLPDPTAGVDMSDLGTWTYSDNAARGILRYLLDHDGWGLDATDIDQASFEAAMDFCDETIDAEPRYRIWGRYTTTDERSSVLRELLEACDGKLIEQPSGTVALVVGRIVTSNIFLTDDDIIEAQFEPFGDTLDRVGSVRPRIVLESNDWQETDLDSVDLPVPDADQALKQVDLPLKYCPSEKQAWRLAGARLRQLNPAWRGTIVTRLRALQAFGDRWININFSPLGINQQFEMVGGISLNAANMTCTMQVRSVEADDYDAPAGVPTITRATSANGSALAFVGQAV